MITLYMVACTLHDATCLCRVSQHVLGTRLNFCEKNDAFFFACDFRFFLFSGQDVCVCVCVFFQQCQVAVLSWVVVSLGIEPTRLAREKQLFAFNGRLSWVL